MKKRMIASLCIIALFLLTACTREQAASAPSAPSALPSADTADLTGDIVSADDEQELDALSQSLEEDIDLAGLDDLVGVD